MIFFLYNIGIVENRHKSYIHNSLYSLSHFFFFRNKEEIHHLFTKLEISLWNFRRFKIFPTQLIDSSIPWLKWLAQQETKFLRGWSNVSCARSDERGSLPCRVEIYTPARKKTNGEEIDQKKSLPLPPCLSFQTKENRTQFSLSIRGTVSCIDFSFTLLFVLPLSFLSFFTGVRNLLKFQFISRDFRCLNITIQLRKISHVGHPIS